MTQPFTASEMRFMADEWEAEATNTAAEFDGPDDPLKDVIEATVKRATDTAQMLRQAADAMEGEQE